MVLRRNDRRGVRAAGVLPIGPGAAHFEDGTVNYLTLPAVEIGLRLLDRIGLETIHIRVGALGVLAARRARLGATQRYVDPVAGRRTSR